MNFKKLAIFAATALAFAGTAAAAEEGATITFTTTVEKVLYYEPSLNKVDEVAMAFANLLEKKAEAEEVWTACKQASVRELSAGTAYNEAVKAALENPDAAAETDDLLTTWRDARQAKETTCAKVVGPTKAFEVVSMTANNALVAMLQPLLDRVKALEEAKPEVTKADLDALLERIEALEEKASVSQAVVEDCRWEHPGNEICRNPAVAAAVEKATVAD